MMPNAISRSMQYLGRYYVRYFNYRYRRSGTLYEGRFKSSIVQCRNYLLACQRYIELNPVRAGMVNDPADYIWSSYRAHALGVKVKMWTPHSEYLALGPTSASRLLAYRKLVGEELGSELISEIRKAANTGLVLGNDCFKREVEQLTASGSISSNEAQSPRLNSIRSFYSDPNDSPASLHSALAVIWSAKAWWNVIVVTFISLQKPWIRRMGMGK